MILGILQARMSSTRLPGKVLLPVLAQPMLARQVERLRRSHRIDQLVLATSTESSDDQLQQLAAHLDMPCARGPLDDVLERFHRAAEAHGGAHIVRLTGDCPLTDPDIIDACIAKHLQEGNDYTSNIDPPTWPDGLDVEVVAREALEIAWREAEEADEREHVTLYIRRHPERFTIDNLEADVDRSHLRWTVDEPEDLEFVRTVYETLYPAIPTFTTADILDLIEQRPELKREWKR